MKMPLLGCSKTDFTCFETCLVDQEINSDQVHRVALMDQSVYNWCLSADTFAKSEFAQAIEGLKPTSVRQAGVSPTGIHRRAVVGIGQFFEVLATTFKVSSECEKVMIFSPFVGGETEGVTQIGILIWAVCSDSEASMYKTLISNTDFMRNRFKTDDRFLPHKDLVLELGKDVRIMCFISTCFIIVILSLTDISDIL